MHCVSGTLLDVFYVDLIFPKPYEAGTVMIPNL